MKQHREVGTLREYRDTISADYAAQPALRNLSEEGVTYGKLGERSRAVEAELDRRGIRRGDRVVLLAENRPEWGMWYLGVTARGAVIVPILTDFHERQIAGIIEHCEPELIVVSTQMSQAVTETKVEQIRIDEVWELPEALGTDRPDQAPAPDDLAALLYTSGTTGTPKGVMLSHKNLMSNVEAGLDVFPIVSEDRLLSILPLAHTYECTVGFLTPLRAGASITYLGGPPTISRLLPAFEEVHPTIMLSVPLILEKVYQAKVAPIFAKVPAWIGGFAPVRKLIHRIAVGKLSKQFGGNIRFFGLGGAPISPATERFLFEGGFPYAVGYGLTETAPLLAGADVAHQRLRSTGPAVKGVELRLQPVEGGSAGKETSREGEVQARGGNIMLGYYRNPEATTEAFTEDGWFKTGDLGSFGKDGYLFIRGRLKSMILGPSGENIYPEEIEAEINAEPIVEESLVLQVGGNLVARVRLNAEAVAKQVGAMAGKIDVETFRAQANELLERLRKDINARMNRFSKLAKVVLQEEEFERTPTRKIKRFLYQQQDRTAT
ncbi:MAG: AMP-binding protein [Spirochaetales bacterium]